MDFLLRSNIIMFIFIIDDVFEIKKKKKNRREKEGYFVFLSTTRKSNFSPSIVVFIAI